MPFLFLRGSFLSLCSHFRILSLFLGTNSFFSLFSLPSIVLVSFFYFPTSNFLSLSIIQSIYLSAKSLETQLSFLRVFPSFEFLPWASSYYSSFPLTVNVARGRRRKTTTTTTTTTTSSNNAAAQKTPWNFFKEISQKGRSQVFFQSLFFKKIFFIWSNFWNLKLKWKEDLTLKFF